MTRLAVLGYASGSPLSHLVMRRIAADHDLLAVVTPARGPRGWLSRLLRRGGWRGMAVRIVGENAAARYAPDLIVVASYPGILPVSALERARIGALNVHMSLLPRHRGIDPVFSTYWHDDADAGVTIHWMDAGVDSGAIAARERVPLARGRASRDLYFDLADRAAALVAALLRRIAAGDVPRHTQTGEATVMTSADIAKAHVPLAAWSAERVWHVLRGLGDQRQGLIVDGDGAVLRHGPVSGWRASSESRPGRIEPVSGAYELHCADGIVTVERDN